MSLTATDVLSGIAMRRARRWSRASTLCSLLIIGGAFSAWPLVWLLVGFIGSSVLRWFALRAYDRAERLMWARIDVLCSELREMGLDPGSFEGLDSE